MSFYIHAVKQHTMQANFNPSVLCFNDIEDKFFRDVMLLTGLVLNQQECDNSFWYVRLAGLTGSKHRSLTINTNKIRHKLNDNSKVLATLNVRQNCRAEHYLSMSTPCTAFTKCHIFSRTCVFVFVVLVCFQFLHCVPKKRSHFYFFNNSVKC